MIDNELIKELAILNAGQNPAWEDQSIISAPNGAPVFGSDGIALQGATVAMVGVDMHYSTTAVDLVVWVYSGGQWGAPTNGEISIERNLIERVQVAGCERIYIEVTATDGVCTPRVGPCLGGN